MSDVKLKVSNLQKIFPAANKNGKDLIALNPGSLSYPRQEGRLPSYAIMEIDRDEKVHFTIAYLK